MKVTVLLDHDLEGQVVYLEAGLAEDGWNQIVEIEFVWLRDCGLDESTPDNEIWRYAQKHRMLLLTNNRNHKGATSLHATIARENTPASLPVITVSDKDDLRLIEYRQKAVEALVEIILDLENVRGTGRIFIPDSTIFKQRP